ALPQPKATDEAIVPASGYHDVFPCRLFVRDPTKHASSVGIVANGSGWQGCLAPGSAQLRPAVDTASSLRQQPRSDRARPEHKRLRDQCLVAGMGSAAARNRLNPGPTRRLPSASGFGTNFSMPTLLNEEIATYRLPAESTLRLCGSSKSP